MRIFQLLYLPVSHLYPVKYFNKRSIMTSINMQSRLNGDHLVSCPSEKYDDLLAAKVHDLTTSLSFCYQKPPEVFESPKSHFRMRANFNIWKDIPLPAGADTTSSPINDADNFYYCMYDEHSTERVPYEITTFPRGTMLMNDLMSQLMIGLKQAPCLYKKLFEARFVTTKLGQAIIVLLYHIQLNEDWRQAAEALSSSLGCKIVGRSRKQKLVVGGSDDIIEEDLHVHGSRVLRYFQTEGAFSQPNAIVCEKMLSWSLDATSSLGGADHDLLELYCGGGTFTAALSQNYRKVLATEISKPSVELAQRCFKHNNITNVKIARLSSEEFTDAYVKKTPFRRLTENGIHFHLYNFNTVFVDPPRAGVDEDTCRLMVQFENIVYVSCNPETLARDLKTLTRTHEVRRLAAFDQFPYTKHLESGVLLTRKTAATSVVEAEDDSTASSKKQRID